MSAGLVLTNSGSAEIEAAYQAGETVKITLCSFGDGGGEPVTADPSATALKGRFGEVPLSAGDAFDGMIGGMAIIPCADYPGKIVREFGLESESGTLIAYGAYPETYLPAQGDSVIKELIVKFVMPLVHAENVTLIVDPNIAIITQEEGDKRYYRRSLRLQEVQDEGTAAQQELRENIGCGTSATKDIVTSPTDTTAGRVLTVGYGGVGGYGTTILLAAADAKKTLPNGFYGVQSDPTYGNAALISFGYDSGSQVHIIAKQGGQSPIIGLCGSTPEGVFGNWGKIYTEFQKQTTQETFSTTISIPAEADLNTYQNPGLYYQSANNNAASGSNYPEAGQSGSLEIYKNAGGVTQVYRIYNTSRCWSRSLYNGAWSQWARQYDTINKPTAADAGALPLAGGTMAGIITTSSDGRGSFAGQLGSKAPVYQEIDTTSTSEYWPIVKQKYIQGNSAWSMGVLVSAGRLQIYYSAPNNANDKNFSFQTDGQFIPSSYANFDGKRPARTVLTGMCYSVGSVMRQGSSSLTRLIGQSAMTSST